RKHGDGSGASLVSLNEGSKRTVPLLKAPIINGEAAIFLNFILLWLSDEWIHHLIQAWGRFSCFQNN
uniref:hypothetical protein n=1 Tax=Halalkalibacter wakoensis TaxID=127891 RepID=UPI00054E58CD